MNTRSDKNIALFMEKSRTNLEIKNSYSNKNIL